MAPTTIEVEAGKDFDKIWTAYAQNRLEQPTQQKSTIRAVHGFAVCLSLLSNAVSKRPEHKRVFLQEATSDNVHLMHTLMMGDARGSIFYLRSVVENFWRHHYFSTHEVEFNWLHTRAKYHLKMSELREYCLHLDEFSGDLGDSLKFLSDSYAELSKQVHSTSTKTLVLRDSVSSIKLTVEQCDSLDTSIREVFKDFIVLSICSARDVFDGLHVNAQAFILQRLDAKRRKRRQACL